MAGASSPGMAAGVFPGSSRATRAVAWLMAVREAHVWDATRSRRQERLIIIAGWIWCQKDLPALWQSAPEAGGRPAVNERAAGLLVTYEPRRFRGLFSF